MKLLVGLLSILIILASCSTTSKPATTIKKSDLMEEKEFDDIENSDFESSAPAEVYTPSKDRYVIPAVSLNRAQQESSELIAVEHLEQLADNDPLAEIMNECRYGDMAKFKGRVQKLKKSQIKNPAFWNAIASCYIHKREWAKAKIFLERTLAIVENYTPALNNYGVLLASVGDEQMALQLFQQASKGVSIVARINLALLYLKYFHAEKALQTVSSIQGIPHWKVSAIKGTAEYMLGRSGKAVEYFQSIVKPDEMEKSNFNLNYALALFGAGEKDKAKDQYLKGADHYKVSTEMITKIQQQLGI